MPERHMQRMVYVVDDDPDLGGSIARLLRRHGYVSEPFLDPSILLKVYADAPAHCVVTDIMMGEVNGFDFAEALRAQDTATAIVFMTAWPTTANAVDAVRRFGGLDYLEKPIDEQRLLQAIAEGCAWSARRRIALERIERLTAREKEVLTELIQGKSNKVIAVELGLSPKTIEDHRAAIVAKTGTNGLAQLIKFTKDAF